MCRQLNYACCEAYLAGGQRELALASFREALVRAPAEVVQEPVEVPVPDDREITLERVRLVLYYQHAPLLGNHQLSHPSGASGSSISNAVPRARSVAAG